MHWLSDRRFPRSSRPSPAVRRASASRRALLSTWFIELTGATSSISSPAMRGCLTESSRRVESFESAVHRTWPRFAAAAAPVRAASRNRIFVLGLHGAGCTRLCGRIRPLLESSVGESHPCAGGKARCHRPRAVCILGEPRAPGPPHTVPLVAAATVIPNLSIKRAHYGWLRLPSRSSYVER